MAAKQSAFRKRSTRRNSCVQLCVCAPVLLRVDYTHCCGLIVCAGSCLGTQRRKEEEEENRMKAARSNDVEIESSTRI